MTLFSDEQLASGIKNGNTGELTLLVERYHAPLLGFLYRMTGGDRGLAEDLVQETFLRVLNRIDTYNPARPFKPWLYAIAVNLVRDYYKQADYRHTDSLSIQDDPPGSGTPESVILETEETNRVAVAMTTLPVTQRVVILLRYFQDLSLQEISQILHIPVGTVKSRLSLGLRRLKERMMAEP